MKKKNLNEGCACEGEETTPAHEEFISGDKVSRYILQMTDEEQDRVDDFREVLAGILKTKPENIKGFKRSGLGYKVKVEGGMDELDDIMDDNADVLRRLKDSDDDTYTPDTLDDDFMVDDVDDDVDDDMEEWEREGYNSEIAYRNRWRDYQD